MDGPGPSPDQPCGWTDSDRGPEVALRNSGGDHEPDWPLSPEQVREWSVLNTYDMLAPAHDHPQDARTLQRWFREGGLHKVEVFRGGHLIGRGIKQVATLGRTQQ